VPVSVNGFGAREELVHEVGEPSRVIDMGEVPGAVEQLKTAAGQSLVGVDGVVDGNDRIPGPGDEQDRCLG
jgi:hypothetical protein